ncbi:MAG TPA: RsmE family RNA methyltransferase, partial [candidate division Zixibacteria bacterium]
VQFRNQVQEKNKTERWGRVATSAMKQSLRCFLPKVSQVTKLEDLLKNIKRYDLALMASLESRSRKLEDLSELKNRPKNVLLLVGPEAGFSSDELGEALGRGVFPVTLGARRLRSETAGVLFSSLVLYELKELA